MVSPSNFSRAFQAEQRLITDYGEVTLTPYNIGELVLTSGKLVACDPLVFPDSEPFIANLPPGCYPVLLSVAQIQNRHDRRVAYAMLRISEQTPIRWEMATVPGQDLSCLEEGKIFGYGVDSGIGCFMDTDAAKLIDASSETETFEESLAGKLLEAMEENRSHNWQWATLCVNDSTGANVIAFKSGWGDSFYASYFGYDAEDNIVNIVTDFYLFDSA